MMELVIPFKKADFSDDGTHLPSERFIMELQRDWEESYHNKYSPLYANTIEGHPSAMLRLTRYMDAGETTEYDFGMELVNGEIDIDSNIEMEKFSKYKTVYAIGSMLPDKEDEPIYLVKNDGLGEEILVLKFTPDDEESENESVDVPSDLISILR